MGDAKVIPGIHLIAAPGHTPGHTAFVVGSGKDQLMVLSDTTNTPALFAKQLTGTASSIFTRCFAETTRRRLFDRAVSDKSLLAGYHFPFPAVGTIATDGAGYTFVPADANGNGHRLLTAVAVLDALFGQRGHFRGNIIAENAS